MRVLSIGLGNFDFDIEEDDFGSPEEYEAMRDWLIDLIEYADPLRPLHYIREYEMNITKTFVGNEVI